MPRARSRSMVLVLAAFVLGAMCGCSSASRAKTLASEGGKGPTTFDSFLNTMTAAEGMSFEATYELPGSPPESVIYDVKPPTDVAFWSTDLGLDLISNASGQYDCSPTAINGTPRCQKDAVDTAASSEYVSGPMYGRFGVFEQVGGHLKLCTTPQSILGLINDTTLFELQRYSTSPAASRFRIPTRR